MKIIFKDFYKQTKTVKKNVDTIFGRFEKDEPAKENLAQVVERINDWIYENNNKILNVETLYIKSSEQYFEFIRVWYMENIQLDYNDIEIQTEVETSSIQTQTDFDQMIMEKKSGELLDFF